MDNPWRVKFSRAEQHLKNLDAEIDTYLAGHPYKADVESWDGSTLITRVDITGSPSVEMSPLIGDILHNQLSTLDSIYFALIKYKSDNESKFKEIERKLYFPIVDDEAAFDKYPGIYEFGDSQLKRALRQFQPFHLVMEEGDVELRKSHIYKQLKAYANLDKHRGINVLHMVADDVTLFHSGDLKYLGARRLKSEHDKVLRHEFHFENPQNSDKPIFDVKINLALENPAGHTWVTNYSASSLLHIIQSHNNWAILVAEYILGGGTEDLLASLNI